MQIVPEIEDNNKFKELIKNSFESLVTLIKTDYNENLTKVTEDNYKMLYIPKGFAHGFQTLEDNTEISYNISQCYDPKSSKGVRWDDKEFGIKWPLKISIISQKDASYALFSNN